MDLNFCIPVKTGINNDHNCCRAGNPWFDPRLIIESSSSDYHLEMQGHLIVKVDDEKDNATDPEANSHAEKNLV